MEDRNSIVELTNICIVYDGTKVLVEDKIWSGGRGLVFPGGHIEPGESLRDSVVREICEETGLSIKNPCLCGIKDFIMEDGNRYMVMLYKATEFDGTLKASEEGKVFFMERDDFLKAEVIWNMKDLLKVAEDETLSEAFYRETEEDGWKAIFL